MQSFVFGSPSTDMQNTSAAKDYFGENISTLRQLMKQPWTYLYSRGRLELPTSYYAALESYRFKQVYLLTYPLSQLSSKMISLGQFIDKVHARGIYADSYPWTTGQRNLNRFVVFNYLRRCFAGMRGSFKYFVTVEGAVANRGLGTATVARWDLNELSIPADDLASGGVVDIPNGPIVGYYNYTATGVSSSFVSLPVDPSWLCNQGVQRFPVVADSTVFSFELPGFCTEGVIYDRTDPTTSAIDLLGDDCGNYPVVGLVLDFTNLPTQVSGSNTISEVPVKFDVSIGEDFNFVWWAGIAPFGVT